jgi:hypothetical protein
VDTELVSRLEERLARRPIRVVAIELLGPLTMLAGVVWAIAQPYRLVFLHPAGRSVYDWIAQPPLLVVAVGMFFAAVIAPSLVEDLRGER